MGRVPLGLAWEEEEEVVVVVLVVVVVVLKMSMVP